MDLIAELSQDEQTGRWSALCTLCPHLMKNIATTEAGARYAFDQHVSVDHSEES